MSIVCWLFGHNWAGAYSMKVLPENITTGLAADDMKGLSYMVQQTNKCRRCGVEQSFRHWYYVN